MIWRLLLLVSPLPASLSSFWKLQCGFCHSSSNSNKISFLGSPWSVTTLDQKTTFVCLKSPIGQRQESPKMKGRRGGSSGGGRSGGGQRSGGKPKSGGGQLPRAPRKSTPKPGYTYKLNLKDGKKYVGFTANPSKRLQQHFQGKGSEWTKKHPPTSVSYIKKHESIKTAKKAETKEYCSSKNKHGADNVRGAGNTRSVP